MKKVYSVHLSALKVDRFGPPIFCQTCDTVASHADILLARHAMSPPEQML